MTLRTLLLHCAHTMVSSQMDPCILLYKHDHHPGAPLLYSSRQIYQNNSLINSQDVDNMISSAVLCLTNQFPCCTDIDDGSWYDPSGSLLPDGSGIFEIPTVQRFYLAYFNRQVVALLSIEGSDGISEGLFHCQIFDRENVAQYLYIGIYSSRNGKKFFMNDIMMSM